MKKLGLIGYPLSHSFSASYFKQKFEKLSVKDYSYELFPLKSIEDLPKLIKEHPNLVGLNVTIPYKEVVIPYLSNLEDRAKNIGAVNVIKIVDGKLTGFNSDYIGFKNSLTALLPPNFKSEALILGTGGAAKAVKQVLNDLSIPFTSVSRDANKGITYNNLAEDRNIMDTHKLIINCTPLGTHPAVDEKPELPYQLLNKNYYLFDLVYNPDVTAFMQKGIELGAQVKNGYDMLVGQAEAAWNIWQKN